MGKTVIPVDANLKAEGPITKTADFNGASLDLGAGWAPDPLAPVGVLIPVTACDGASADETYDFYIEESSDNSTFSATGCSINVPRGTTGVFQSVFKSTKRYTRARLDVGGTTPSITYSVYFGPIPSF